MNLHEQLRDLVTERGTTVLDTAEGFRAALDDYLTEDEASTGEVNLLVDAVRLGALNRLLTLLDHGGEPVAAIGEAGEAMARDRGTDDTARSEWAVAALGFALGRLDGDDVRPKPSSLPAPPSLPASYTQPRPEPTARVSRPRPTTLDDREPERSTWDHAGSPRRRPVRLVVALVVLLAAGAVAGWLLLDDDGDPGSADDGGDPPPSETIEPSVDPSADVPQELGSDTVLIAANDGENTRIFQVDADSGEAQPLTSGPSDNFPTVSRTREQVVFLVRATQRSVRPMVLDLASRSTRPLFGDDGACEYGRRPGFDLSGDRMALVCLDADGGQTGLFVVNPDGTLDREVEVDATVRGSPTWVSESEIVYARSEGNDEPFTLVQVNVDTGEERQLTDGTEGWDSQPVWCEARDTLLFVRSVSATEGGELWTIADRGFAERLPIDEPVDGPVWSPGCERLAFTVESQSGPALVTAPADAPADYTPVDPVPGEITVPSWDTR